MPKTTIASECSRCGATGLYIGMAEQDGMAVQCHTCNGTGKEIITVQWTPFTKRKEKRGVKQVLEANPGIGAAPGVTPGGISYREWNSGKGFPKRGAEMREHTCPAWWYQSVDYRRKPGWNECIGCGQFSECPSFKNKKKCWERFDREGR